MRGPEAKIQDAVVKYARERGVICKKNEVGRFFVGSGWPDFMFLFKKNKIIFVEFKAPGGKLTPLQDEQRKRLEAFGFKYYVVNSTAFGKVIVDGEFG